MKKTKTLLVSFLIFSILFLPISPSSFFVFSQEIEEMPEYVEITEDFEINDMFFIPEGTTVVVKKGVEISMNNGSLIIEGKMIIKGTIDEPVRVKKVDGSANYSIEIWDGGRLEMMNANVSGGGSDVQIMGGKKSFFDTAYAFGSQGAINVNGGSLRAQNVNFHDNLIAVSIFGYDSGGVNVNRSKFINNPKYEVINSSSGYVDFRYNWWGNPEGPVRNCEVYYSCWPISGTVDSSDHLTKPDFTDPVIIIPGILGSWKWTEGGNWKVDPIFGTYDNLVETFEKNGYDEGENLFTFPYQWRDSNVNNAVLLKEKIQEIKEKTNWPKVDIVAHSMGGLLTREYIESDYYQDDIDQLVMLGTPNKGAPKSYYAWDGGEPKFFDLETINEFTKWIFKQEAKEAGFENIFDYLHNMPIRSVQELLPDYDYLKNVDNGELRTYPENYPRNEFLEELNEEENVRKLNSVSVINITGKLDSDKTIGVVKVGESSSEENSVWAHGEPESFELTEGDGTAPKFSSESVPYDDQREINFSHTTLPGEAANLVYKKITGYDPQEEIPFAGIEENLFFFVFSPIDIQIISPSGKWIGKNIKNLDEIDELKGGYYTGHETENEFVAIQNPEDGEYQIVTEGISEGEYKIQIVKIFEDEDGTAREITNEITGVTEEGFQEEKNITLKEYEITVDAQDETPPEISITNPKEKEYRNDEIIPIEFSIEDEASGVDSEKTKIILDDEIFENSEIDAAYFENGKHILRIEAFDLAGNSSFKELEFSIISNIDSIISNVGKYYKDRYITKKSTKKFLDVKLKVIKNHIKLLDFIERIPWRQKKFKDRFSKNIERIINQEIFRLISDIKNNKKISKTILEPAKSVLISNLENIKIK